jgi:hypothetical protein
MEDQKTTKVPGGWPGVMLIAALASNLLWLHSPLKSARPAEEARIQTASLGDQTAEARLWQDPFEAVSLHRGKAGTGGLSSPGGTDLNGVVDQIRRPSNHGTNLIPSGQSEPAPRPPGNCSLPTQLLTDWLIRAV